MKLSVLLPLLFAAPASSSFSSLGVKEVREQLETWNLEKVFGEAFEQVGIDGESLVHTSQAELEAAFASSGVAKMHWRRLERRLKDVRAEIMAEQAQEQEVGAAGGFEAVPHRHLSEAADMDLSAYSGVDIAANQSMVKFSSDMAVIRTSDGLTIVAPNVRITGDLAVDGSSQGISGAQGSGYGQTMGNPAPSCRRILQKDSTQKNGVYYLTRLGSRDAYAAYCDMDRGGLELIFKISHGVGGDAVDIWESSDGLNEDAATMNLLQNDNYAAQDKADIWDHPDFRGIHAHVMQGNRVARYIAFDPAGSDSDSWFSGDYAVESDWTDLLTEDKNFFSIDGDNANYGRAWFVNRNYGGCSVDAGWLVLDDETSDPCDWEEVNNGPSGAIDILYSPYTTYGNADDDWLQADAFAVLVDVDTVYKSCRHAMSNLNYVAEDGQYWVNHNNNTDPHLVYCDMTNGGYELVFKVVHGGGVDDAYALWSDTAYDTSVISGQNADPVTWVEHYASPFRYGAFDDDNIAVSDVDVRIITDGDVQKYMHFVVDGDATDESWFSSDYLQDSSWTDLTTADINFFGIKGDSNYDRSWFVNSNYGGCSVDAGWLAVPGSADGVCTWEDQEQEFPDIRYSRLKTKDEADTYGVADLLAVFYLWD